MLKAKTIALSCGFYMYADVYNFCRIRIGSKGNYMDESFYIFFEKLTCFIFLKHHE